MTSPFNPLDLDNLAASIGSAILSSTPTRLDRLTRFSGAGIYALYYTGNYTHYKLLADANSAGAFAQPIYVGKAVPSGARRGITIATSTSALFNRVNDHRQSIDAAFNLDLRDFFARWLVVEPIWVPLGETLLIGRFAPVWNALLDGFGNHDPGAGRRVGLNSRWDTLHPGRTWAALSAERGEDVGAIGADVEEYIRSRMA